MLTDTTFHKLKTTGIGRDNFLKELEKSSEFSDIDISLQLYEAQGLHIIEQNHRFYFESALTRFEKASFCIVDIEVNGMDHSRHQIIEIGAVKYEKGKIVDTFESLVQCSKINPLITEITGIDATMCLNAPKLCDVMRKFRLFLGDSIFVAHDIQFDYSYISKTFQKCLLEPLLNRKLCSIQLSERTISSYKYGLKYLNESLHLYQDAEHHRALSDAITTTHLLDLLLKKVPKHLKTVEDVIEFSHSAKRMKRDKFDPVIVKKLEEEKRAQRERIEKIQAEAEEKERSED